jgi:hypothetical protein
VYSISNGSVFDIVRAIDGNVTDYSTANQFCQLKGGHLAVVDSKIKQDVVSDLIKTHLKTFGLGSVNYLLGKVNDK